MQTDMLRVMAAAAMVLAGSLAAGVLAGEVALVLGFVAGFAIATWVLDPEVRAFLRKGQPTSPAATPAAPSSARTSAPGWDAPRAPAAD